jgi:hypothetical protein
MRKSTNPLDSIRIASPCGADWNEMYGDDRQRYCSMCRLNVYNVSEMTREAAENFLINAEGSVCLRVYRRRDGTVMTRDCPVGWARIKRNVSRAASAVFALIAGFFGGIFALDSFKAFGYSINDEKILELPPESESETISFGGRASNLPQIKLAILKNREN